MLHKETYTTKRYLRKVFWIAVFLIALIWFLNDYLDSRKREQIKEQERVEAALKLNEKISHLVRKHDALVEWDYAIFDTATVRLKPILTVELEKIWLRGRPILFVGRIMDIATMDALHYQITLEYPIIRGKVILQNKLRIEVKLPKSNATEILALYKKESSGFFSGAAAIAQIRQIETKPSPNSESGDILSGIGQCLEILYVSNLREVNIEF